MLTTGPLTPSADTIRAARDEAGMTQAQAAAVVHVAAISWKKWESGKVQMPAGLFELFCLKTEVENPFYPDLGGPPDID